MAFYNQPHPKHSQALAASQSKAKFSCFQSVVNSKVGTGLQSSGCLGMTVGGCHVSEQALGGATRLSSHPDCQIEGMKTTRNTGRWNDFPENQLYSAITWKFLEYFGIPCSVGEERSRMGCSCTQQCRLETGSQVAKGILWNLSAVTSAHSGQRVCVKESPTLLGVPQCIICSLSSRRKIFS